MVQFGCARRGLLSLGLGALLLGAVIISIAIAQAFVIDGYRRLERESLDKDLRRATTAFKHEIEKLDLLARDWATWDASYGFIVDLDAEYKEQTLVDEALVNIQINAIVYADVNNVVRYRKSVDLQTGEVVSFSPSFALYLAQAGPLFDHTASDGRRCGLLKLAEGYLLVASRPIIRSDGGGEPRGTLIMARYLDDAFVQTLVSTTYLALDILDVDDARLPAEVHLSPAEPLASHEIDKNFLAGYRLVNDLSGLPVLVIRISVSRDLYIHSSDALMHFLSILMIVCAAFVVVVTGIYTRHMDLQHTNTRLEARVTARTHELSEALAAKSRILANISHDARTPLNVITLNVQMMQRIDHDARCAPRLDNILLSVNQLLGFFDNLVTEAHTTTIPLYEKTELTPGQLLTRALKPLRVLADVKGLNVETDIDPTLPPLLIGEVNRLEQILANLFGNAVKFTAQGGIIVRLLHQTDTTWALEVRDSGRGIAPEHQTDIFRAFWQVDGSITRETNRGVGLGLAVVQQLATRMGGLVRVHSELNVGSTFTVIFPLRLVVEGEGDGERVVG